MRYTRERIHVFSNQFKSIDNCIVGSDIPYYMVKSNYMVKSKSGSPPYCELRQPNSTLLNNGFDYTYWEKCHVKCNIVVNGHKRLSIKVHMYMLAIMCWNLMVGFNFFALHLFSCVPFFPMYVDAVNL